MAHLIFLNIPFFIIKRQGSSNTFTGYCLAGYHCIGGSSTKTPTDGVTGERCPEGKYCVEGTPSPENCPPGTFANVTGLKEMDECIQCTEGMYCNNHGLKRPFGECSPRYYCSGGSQSPNPVDNVTGGPCIPGHYCPLGSAKPLPCSVSFQFVLLCFVRSAPERNH